MKGARQRIVVPDRISNPRDFGSSMCTAGFVKFRLGHTYGRSFVTVDVVIALRSPKGREWGYFLPSFLGPPVLFLNTPEKELDTTHLFKVSMDVCKPRNHHAMRVILEVRSCDWIRSYPDGAQLYRCTIEHPQPLYMNRSGSARRNKDDFELQLYHHTMPDTRRKIVRSMELWGSPWNLQGTRKLTNVCYPYFTTLPKVRDEADLRRIAMASTGKVLLEGEAEGLNPVIELKVYRGNTSGRTATLMVWVPIETLAPNHLLFFEPQGQPAYYEVILPEVARVGLKPGCVLPLQGNKAMPIADDLKTFSYIVCGSASVREGLEAPFDEENTNQIVHHENLQGQDIFDYWINNQNSDIVTGRNPETMILD